MNFRVTLHSPGSGTARRYSRMIDESQTPGTIPAPNPQFWVDFIFSCVVNVPKNSKAVLPVERKINVLITFSSRWSSQPAPRQGIWSNLQARFFLESSWLHAVPASWSKVICFTCTVFRTSHQYRDWKSHIHHLAASISQKPSEFEWILCLGSHKLEGGVGRTEFVIGVCLGKSASKFIQSLRLQNFGLILVCCPPEASLRF